MYPCALAISALPLPSLILHPWSSMSSSSRSLTNYPCRILIAKLIRSHHQYQLPPAWRRLSIWTPLPIIVAVGGHCEFTLGPHPNFPAATKIAAAQAPKKLGPSHNSTVHASRNSQTLREVVSGYTSAKHCVPSLVRIS